MENALKNSGMTARTSKNALKILHIMPEQRIWFPKIICEPVNITMHFYVVLKGYSTTGVLLSAPFHLIFEVLAGIPRQKNTTHSATRPSDWTMV